MKNADTIFASSSGSGKSAIRVFRISGPAAREVGGRLGLGALPPRAAVLRKVLDPESGECLDSGLVLWFPAPASFTGEDSLELHLHGGRAIEKSILKALGRLSGCRLAEPGEFSWRAFTRGKLDLAQAEELADLIDAETDVQRRQALRQSGGGLWRAAERWRSDLLSCLALVEGEIDFEEEEDVPKGVWSELSAGIARVRDSLRDSASTFARAEIVKEGFRVAILGPPNAGKSSLLNAVADREAAIVSSVPGTTRDPIEVDLDLGGAPVILIDTAGVRESADEVEQIGIARAKARAAEAQLVVWLAPDLEQAPPPDFEGGAPVLLVRSKCDLAKPDPTRDEDVMDELAVSAKTGEGLSELLSRIAAAARTCFDEGAPGDSALLTNMRQFGAVSAAADMLDGLAHAPAVDLEIIAEALRAAARALESLTGRIDSEDVLGDIFSRFCVGK